MVPHRPKISPILLLFLIIALLFSIDPPDSLYASDGNSQPDTQLAMDMSKLLEMDIKDLMNIEVVSATRSAKPISEVAENMEVITAEDIEFMNAHTVLDVLNMVPGVNVRFGGPGPGNLSSPSIQGSDETEVTVLLDGVSVNALSSAQPEFLTRLPVQIVERIEIIKGPASSAWGSSIGGIINIITKSGNGAKSLNGTLSASYGERNTGDYRAEAYGAKDKFEYYLYAGNLNTDGLSPHFNTDGSSLYSKLAYNFTDDTKVTGTFYYDRGTLGEGDSIPYNSVYNYRTEHVLGTLSLDSRLSPEVSLNILASTQQQVFKSYVNQLSDGLETYNEPELENHNSVSGKLIYASGIHTAVLGAEYTDGIMKDYLSLPGGRQQINEQDVFINDTLAWNKLSVTPGIRYDDTNSFGSFISPSLGATYKLTDNTLFRATASRGFNNPTVFDRYGVSAYYAPNPDLTVEKVTSYQVGVETTALPYLWAKVSAFRNDLSNALVQVPVINNSEYYFTLVNGDKLRRQGIEAEAKTSPLYHTSLFAGATLISYKDLLTGLKVPDSPSYIFDAGIKYDDDKSLKAILQGHYVWWNEEDYANATYNAMIFDFSVTKTVLKQKDQACDIFFTAHNIFDGTQEPRNYYPNAGRWLEGGVRYKF